jgi:hypothetical protein
MKAENRGTHVGPLGSIRIRLRAKSMNQTTRVYLSECSPPC